LFSFRIRRGLEFRSVFGERQFTAHWRACDSGVIARCDVVAICLPFGFVFALKYYQAHFRAVVSEVKVAMAPPDEVS
jgi:hypothetical protein